VAIPTDAASFIVELADTLTKATLTRLERTPPGALHWHIDHEANSIGVTIWHYTRWVDHFGTVLLVGGARADEHWYRDGWAERTGYDPNAKGRGGLGLLTGYSAEEMHAVPQLSAAELREYHTAASASFRQALAREDQASLERKVFFVDRDVARYDVIMGLLLGENRHIGESDALRARYPRRRSLGS